jgi:hypothetical protein
MVSCGDEGTCFQDRYAETPVAQAFAQLARAIAP